MSCAERVAISASAERQPGVMETCGPIWSVAKHPGVSRYDPEMLTNQKSPSPKALVIEKTSPGSGDERGATARSGDVLRTLTLVARCGRLPHAQVTANWADRDLPDTDRIPVNVAVFEQIQARCQGAPSP